VPPTSNPPSSQPSGPHYPAAAVALAVVALILAAVVVFAGFRGYDPDSASCRDATQRGGSLSSLPSSCVFPAWPLVYGAVIAIGGLGAAAKVWQRK